MTTVTGRHGQEYCQLCNPRPDNHPKLYFRSNVHSLFCRNLPRAILTCPPRNQPRQIVKQTRQPSPTHNPMHTHDDVFEAIGGFLGQVCVEPNGAISWNGIRNTAPSAPTPLPAPSSTEPCPLPPSTSDSPLIRVQENWGAPHTLLRCDGVSVSALLPKPGTARGSGDRLVEAESITVTVQVIYLQRLILYHDRSCPPCCPHGLAFSRPWCMISVCHAPTWISTMRRARRSCAVTV